MKVAIIGGTGKLGLGFVRRVLHSSHEAAIGSRDPQKAVEAAANDSRVHGMSNAAAAEWCDAAIIAVPYSAHREIVSPLAGRLSNKVVVDATVPLNFQNLFRPSTESGNSAAEETAALLVDANVFAAFQTVSHRILRKVDEVEDVLVAGEIARKADVLALVRDLNLRPIDAGPLQAARLLESVTALLLSINRQNGVKESGFRITGV